MSERTQTEEEYMEAARARDDRLRWVACEACGGSGEIIYGNPHFGNQEPDEHSELCSACSGTGRDCVKVSPVECDDDQASN